MERGIKLGQLIRELENMPQDKDVYFDFCMFRPASFDSYRGYYHHLALGYEDAHNPSVKVSELFDLAKQAEWQTFHGYKGGDYLMSPETPVWVANWGYTGSTAIVDVVDIGWCVILKTEFIDD